MSTIEPVRSAAIVGRAGRATLVALVATIALALLAAVVYGGPTRRAPAAAAIATPGSSAHPPATSRAFASPGPLDAGTPAASPIGTPLPELMVAGSPSPRGYLPVRAGGGFRLIDLERGRLGPRIDSSDWDRIVRLPDGKLVCICVARTIAGDSEAFAVTLRPVRLASAGRGTGEPMPVGRYSGSADPLVHPSEESSSVALTVALHPDGRHLFLGRLERRPPSWRLGIDVVDVASGRIVQSIPLGERPSNRWELRGEAAAATEAAASDAAPTPGQPIDGVFVWGPDIEMAPDGRRIIVSMGATVGELGIERTAWTASVDGGHVGELTALRPGLSQTECPYPWLRHGTPESLFTMCWSESGPLHLVILDLDGSVVETVDLAAVFPADSYPMQLLDAARKRLFLWDPFAWRLATVDLASGRVTATATIARDSAAASGAPWEVAARSLSAWIAPVATAKILLDPSIALSPDGSTLYAVGSAMTPLGEASGDAQAIFVLDSATLELQDRWAALGPIGSIAVSDDGRFVYATGLPQDVETGTDAPASLTAYDVETGDVRLVAGRLGSQPLMFEAVLGVR